MEWNIILGNLGIAFMLRSSFRTSIGHTPGLPDRSDLLFSRPFLSVLCLNLSCRGRHSLKRGVDVRGHSIFRVFRPFIFRFTFRYFSDRFPSDVSAAFVYHMSSSVLSFLSFYHFCRRSLVDHPYLLSFLYFFHHSYFFLSALSSIYSRSRSSRVPILFF